MFITAKMKKKKCPSQNPNIGSLLKKLFLFRLLLSMGLSLMPVKLLLLHRASRPLRDVYLNHQVAVNSEGVYINKGTGSGDDIVVG